MALGAPDFNLKGPTPGVILDKCCLKPSMKEVTWKMDGDPSQKLDAQDAQPHRIKISLPAEGGVIFHALFIVF